MGKLLACCTFIDLFLILYNLFYYCRYNLSNYPFLDSVPSEEDIAFTCDDTKKGFYASVKYGCQVIFQLVNLLLTLWLCFSLLLKFLFFLTALCNSFITIVCMVTDRISSVQTTLRSTRRLLFAILLQK